MCVIPADPSDSASLTLRNGMDTLLLVPGHTGTPYILVGGKSTGASNVLKTVCSQAKVLISAFYSQIPLDLYIKMEFFVTKHIKLIAGGALC